MIAKAYICIIFIDNTHILQFSASRMKPFANNISMKLYQQNISLQGSIRILDGKLLYFTSSISSLSLVSFFLRFSLITTKDFQVRTFFSMHEFLFGENSLFSCILLMGFKDVAKYVYMFLLLTFLFSLSLFLLLPFICISFHFFTYHFTICR